MNHSMLLQLTFVGFLFLFGQVQLDTCGAGDFLVSDGVKEYLRINDNGVYACDKKNVCDMLQSLSLSSDGVTLSLSSSNFVNLPDSSATNELQTLELSSSGTLSLTNGNSLQLPDSSDSNELQTLDVNSVTGEISISKGNKIQLPDPSATNEIQTLNLVDSTLSISSANSPVDLKDRLHYIFSLSTTSWSTAGNWQQFQFSTKEYNSFPASALTLTTFTAPWDGWYRFTFFAPVTVSPSMDGRSWVSFRLSTESSASPSLHGGGYIPDSIYRALTGTLNRRLTAGQVIDVWVFTGAGSVGNGQDYAKAIWTGEYLGK